ncbi:unnamed protein product [Clonostachys chloroleuca]|uniref:Zn(2)-C6 fungal-type domain-containing protein n=1 Tax=Clonostachys chloroleuca TaxID=1926264 RepID=A0AA35M703_9HYPO|nr:unnamed protein product [Clonostachys chloroleuca]
MDSGSRKVEKRNRPPVSCEPCRTRKLKCNRELPCDSCVKRNKSSLCHYASNANRTRPAPSGPQRELKERLHTLEAMVSSFLSGDAVIQTDRGRVNDSTRRAPSASGALQNVTPSESNSSPGPAGGEANALTPETPHMHETGDGQVHYIDRNHWLSILEDIKEVREHLSGSSHPSPYDGGSQEHDRIEPDASFLFGANPNVDISDILTSLPPQPVCDRLLSFYFSTRFLVGGVVHPAKFQKEYEAFWDAPEKAPPLWTGLLFALLGFATCLKNIAKAGDIDESIPSTRLMQQRLIQCLILGKYATANSFALEAFLIHLQTSFITSDHAPVNLWFEMGTVIRLAFRMGYHRDPEHLAGISAFDGEMRRRVWLNIFQIEALMSFQLGFPSMIPSEFCDSKVPRNLDYPDLCMDMKELPPSRSFSEHTPVLYTIVKAPVMNMFKKIAAHTQALTVPSYESTLALDAEFNRVYASMPDTFQRRDVNRSFMDSSALILQRCTIEILYLKGLVILHRRYISYDLNSPKYAPSRRASVEAALKILARQEDLHNASGPGGRLHDDRWMVLSLPIHDFLLAAMVLCLDLSVRMRSQSPVVAGDQDLTTREYRALQVSQGIWAGNRSASPETHIAALALELMIKKVANKGVYGFTPSPAPVVDPTAPDIDLELPYAEPMSHMIDGSESLDWGLLDQYFQNLDSFNPDFSM